MSKKVEWYKDFVNESYKPNKNDIIVLPEGLVQSSGKSLLDTYSENGVVTIGNAPEGENYFELKRDDNNMPQGELVEVEN